ncbi:alpha/beta-hydrolase [Panus rudis PR-1116 ss-1]|nr:alpha/beta-hydrolase [Panus rudis PR-1116 ss-1]
MLIYDLTMSYKELDGGAEVKLDLSIPSGVPEQLSRKVPLLVYFHGGGMCVGDRTSWLPHWLKDRILAADIAFLSAEYRLIPPSTGHNVVEDIQDLFRFISSDVNVKLDASHSATKINPEVIAVAGSSAGGFCAYLAAVHVTPKPKVLLSMYGMGGDFLTPYYLMPKQEVFFRGRELLNPRDFRQFLYPECLKLPPISASALAYHPVTSPTPGYPANPRMQLPRLYLQMGTYLDYYTGSFEPSLSGILRPQVASKKEHSENEETRDIISADQIPEKHRSLFPQLNISKSWPPTLLVHGSLDSAVHVHESRYLSRLLAHAGVKVELRVVNGEEHSFDYTEEAQTKYGQTGGLYDDILEFLLQHLT